MNWVQAINKAAKAYKMGKPYSLLATAKVWLMLAKMQKPAK